ncbi:sm-like protein LSM1B isoform X1 [Diospyros lotus]|uniref:sm-like protein LSM1B isoform X1 n=1 Tax=Diospyros lotus TaxID=55363 RepID=UPI002250B797|nr:sm-like protein LSM1B isoform X1 [Diospyros lotus]
MSWAGPEDVYLSTSLANYLDKKLLVLLRDGRKLLGILRSFDQFANAVLEGACERVIVGDLYCDIRLGLYVIRGENVVLIGELDPEKEELPPHMTRVTAEEIRRTSLVGSAICTIPHCNVLSTGTKSRKGGYGSERFHEEADGVPRYGLVCVHDSDIQSCVFHQAQAKSSTNIIAVG